MATADRLSDKGQGAFVKKLAVHLAFKRYCNYQCSIVYGIHQMGRGGIAYCAIVVQ